ncbi:Ig-like domain-containing protein [Flavobacteriaceae bacterium]|nr:Ig-like domain-containing protein [Flavobacteriaceae bacterium]
MQQQHHSNTYRLLYIPIVFLFLLSFTDCAKKGRPSGGLRDTIAPVILRSAPENFTTNFKNNEIRITFDEFIKLKDISKELIISPPLKYPPVITPLSVSKVLKIKILDTLKDNTTYSFNFGNSILDNNEGNLFPNYKYVFSTGSYIDSLTLKGTAIDALLPVTDFPTTVALYQVDQSYKDSLVFLEKPTYITTTINETNNFELSNLKQGTYQLIALKEQTRNYTFQPKTDKIGFYKDLITIPTDSLFELRLFKEVPDFKPTRPKLESSNRISFGYEGKTDNYQITLLTQMQEDFQYRIIKQPGRDTLNFWFKPKVTEDSLVFVTKNKLQIDTTTVRFRELYSDSLRLTAINDRLISLGDTLKLKANTPLVAINSEKISIVTKDSLAIDFVAQINTKENAAQIVFDKQEEQLYSITLRNGALTDYLSNTNDSIVYRQQVKPIADFASLNLTLDNADEFPLLIELIDEKFKVVKQTYLEANAPVFFKHITPGKYFIRLIVDQNKNKIWDPGNFLDKLAPEKVVYYPSIIELRANWSWSETFTLK